MVGGLRLIWALGFVMFAAVLWGEDGSSTTTTAPAAPPKAKVEVVEYNIHGHKIADPYRWMEDSNSPATEEYVREQLAYTRSILDPLPGRAQIHERLKELLSIGTIGTPQIGGKYYFYTRREGSQNQPVLLVREGVHGKDRTLVDVNQLAADGTLRLIGGFLLKMEGTWLMERQPAGRKRARCAWWRRRAGRCCRIRLSVRQDFLSHPGQRHCERSSDFWRRPQGGGCPAGSVGGR